MKEKMFTAVVPFVTAILCVWLAYKLFVPVPPPVADLRDRVVSPTPAVRGVMPDASRTSTVGDDVVGAPEPEVDTAPESAADFVFDVTRLNDPAYENDAGLVWFAAGRGLSASCLLAQIRSRLADAHWPDVCDVGNWAARHDRLYVLPGTYEEVCSLQGAEVICRTERVAAHPFEKLANHELESLALSFPEAAVLLARRSSDPAVSERYYEQAVALSGRPGPLLEWMRQTGIGGLEFNGGDLDVGKAMLGYEIYLVTQAFDHGGPAVDGYADALAGSGVALAPIHQRASERLERLRQLRMSLLGSGWEE